MQNEDNKANETEEQEIQTPSWVKIVNDYLKRKDDSK